MKVTLAALVGSATLFSHVALADTTRTEDPCPLTKEECLISYIENLYYEDELPSLPKEWERARQFFSLSHDKKFVLIDYDFDNDGRTNYQAAFLICNDTIALRPFYLQILYGLNKPHFGDSTGDFKIDKIYSWPNPPFTPQQIMPSCLIS